MTDDEKIASIIHSLDVLALGDIHRAASGGSKMGAFILCSCLIDAISGFEKGADTKRGDYIAFVGRRLQSYDGEELYKDLRCKLVHSYSEGGSYSFTEGKPQLHGKVSAGKSIINLEDFISEVTTALRDFSADIKGLDLSLRGKAIQRYDNNSVIGVQTATIELGQGLDGVSTELSSSNQ